jgi:sulfur-oxidizing protein SoxY
MKSLLAASAALLALLALAPATRAAETEADRQARWTELHTALFGKQQVADGSAVLALAAPERAEDASLVPVSVTVAPGTRIKGLWLVIDDNPSPMAAHLSFGPAADPDMVGLRVRVDQYTDVHAVAELADGHLVAVARFVKAAGGCSAPAGVTVADALQGIGDMRLHVLDLGHAGAPSTVELLIRHPNFNGMQMDQTTRLYTPARYIDQVDVRSGTQLVFHMDSDISLATDPAITFRVRPGTDGLNVVARDTDHATFSHQFTLAGQGA